MTRLIVTIAVFVVIGLPMVGYLWETLNGVLALRSSWQQVGIAIPVLAVFLVLLFLLARTIERWNDGASSRAGRAGGGSHG